MAVGMTHNAKVRPSLMRDLQRMLAYSTKPTMNRYYASPMLILYPLSHPKPRLGSACSMGNNSPLQTLSSRLRRIVSRFLIILDTLDFQHGRL
jgi:hypothetical protein